MIVRDGRMESMLRWAQGHISFGQEDVYLGCKHLKTHVDCKCSFPSLSKHIY
jgi:hypothetical protein